MFLCNFDYRNEKIIDLQQRRRRFSFIPNYLLVVKVGQMFSIIENKCQAKKSGFCQESVGNRTLLPLSVGWSSWFSWQLRGFLCWNRHSVLWSCSCSSHKVQLQYIFESLLLYVLQSQNFQTALFMNFRKITVSNFIGCGWYGGGDYTVWFLNNLCYLLNIMKMLVVGIC